jgi:hypothetical protein
LNECPHPRRTHAGLDFDISFNPSFSGIMLEPDLQLGIVSRERTIPTTLLCRRLESTPLLDHHHSIAPPPGSEHWARSSHQSEELSCSKGISVYPWSLKKDVVYQFTSTLQFISDMSYTTSCGYGQASRTDCRAQNLVGTVKRQPIQY